MKYTPAAALAFIVITGIVSLFADMNYEGGRSVLGQYLKLLGTSALALGFAAGLGELIGYAFRFISGALADRTKKYWTFIIIGYFVQLCSLPAMALVSGWQLAVVFLFLERLGKAIRKPALDALLSFASKQTGSGFGFGLHELLDQIGAFLGPTLFAIFLFNGPNGKNLEAYKMGLLWLFVPAGLAIITVFIAKVRFPKPQNFEIPSKSPKVAFAGFSKIYWILTLTAGFLAFGLADFPIIGLHLAKASAFTEEAIPLLYAGAMVVDAVVAVFAGLLYDKIGLKALGILFVAELFIAPLVFLAPALGIIVGMAFWGISIGTQESILKAAIGDRVPEEKRARGFGLFHMVFGIFWFVGSAIIGALYDGSGALPVVIFSVASQVIACVLFFRGLRVDKLSRG